VLYVSVCIREPDCVAPSLYRTGLPECTISTSPSASRKMIVSLSTTLKASSQGRKGIYRQCPTLLTVDPRCQRSLINYMQSGQRNIMLIISLLTPVPQGLRRNTLRGRPTLRERCRKNSDGISGKLCVFNLSSFPSSFQPHSADHCRFHEA
jgi:hypothetical protein